MSRDRTEVVKCNRCGKVIPRDHGRWEQAIPLFKEDGQLYYPYERKTYCLDCVDFVYKEVGSKLECPACEKMFNAEPDKEGQVECPNCKSYFPLTWVKKYWEHMAYFNRRK
jgi:uncharacterized C2H2 Zn-finger protein